MEITDFIRVSATDDEIRSLLTSYLDALRHGDQLNGLSITSSPLTGVAEVNRRIAALLAELDIASKRLDDRSCAQIKEALHVFVAASNRLQRLDRARRQAIETYRHPTC